MKAAGRISAGILLYRRTDGRLELLLGHPGGPFFERKDHGHWSIPKGEAEPGEELEDVAAREFEEETGFALPSGPRLDLGTIRQKGGKVVAAWAVEGDLDASLAQSNTFRMEWPPRSGSYGDFPEIDRVAWFDAGEARERIKETQVPLVERLEAALDHDATAVLDTAALDTAAPDTATASPADVGPGAAAHAPADAAVDSTAPATTPGFIPAPDTTT